MTYKTMNWHEYNQALKQRGSLTVCVRSGYAVGGTPIRVERAPAGVQRCRDRFRVIDNPALFGLAPVTANRSFVHISEAAMLVDGCTDEMLNLIALANLLID